MRRVASYIVLSFVLLSPLSIAMQESHAPLAAAAVEVEDTQTIVAWIPGPTMADTFRVYGIENHVPHLLAEVEADSTVMEILSAVVPSGYVKYAVSGVKAGVESPLVYALSPGEGNPYCIYIAPPTIGIYCNPLDKIGGPNIFAEVTVPLAA